MTEDEARVVVGGTMQELESLEEVCMDRFVEALADSGSSIEQCKKISALVAEWGGGARRKARQEIVRQVAGTLMAADIETLTKERDRYLKMYEDLLKAHDAEVAARQATEAKFAAAKSRLQAIWYVVKEEVD